MSTRYQVTRPPFVADWDSVDRDTGHTMDWANVGEEYRLNPGGVVEVGSNASADATSVTVEPLPIALASGTTLDFGGKKFARLTDDAAEGATTLTVAALATALVDGDTAAVAGTGPKHVPAGTRMGDAGTKGRMYPRVETTNPAKFILATPATEGAPHENHSAYGVIRGGVIYENLLPGSEGSPKVIPSAEKSELAAAGTGFSFVQYRDNS